MELLLGVVGLFKKSPNYESHRFGIVEEEKKSVNSSCGESRLIGLQPAKHSKVEQGRLDKRLKHSGGGKTWNKIWPAV